MSTKEKILQKAAYIFSESGYDAFNMRWLADSIPLAPSVLYHYFQDKDALLKAMYEYLNTSLGKKRSKLPQPKSAAEMLRERINFQFSHAQEIVAVLKYFIAYRKDFPEFQGGYVPDKTSLHVEEVITYGVKIGEFYSPDIKQDAKVITHAINGYLLEYYPNVPKGERREKLVDIIHQFLLRALVKGGEKK